MGVQKEVVTPVKKSKSVDDPSRFGKPQRYYFIDGFTDEYRSEVEMLEQYKWLAENTNLAKRGTCDRAERSEA